MRTRLCIYSLVLASKPALPLPVAEGASSAPSDLQHVPGRRSAHQYVQLKPWCPPQCQTPCCCFRWGIVPRDKCPDTAIINVYEVDDCIPPHIDHHDFDRPFCTISLLSEESILFSSRITPVSPGVFDCDYSIKLPVGEWGNMSIPAAWVCWHLLHRGVLTHPWGGGCCLTELAAMPLGGFLG